MVWVVLGDAFFKTLALKQYFSSDDDAVKKTNNQMSTVQLSADSQMAVVVKMPLSDDDTMANTLASGKARILGHDYGLGRSPNLTCNGQNIAILKYCLTGR